MKVKELIEALSKQDQDAEIECHSESNYYITSVNSIIDASYTNKVNNLLIKRVRLTDGDSSNG